MDNIGIIEKVEKLTTKERNMRLCQLSVITESPHSTREDMFEMGVIQGNRLSNGEIDKVRKYNEENNKMTPTEFLSKFPEALAVTQDGSGLVLAWDGSDYYYDSYKKEFLGNGAFPLELPETEKVVFEEGFIECIRISNKAHKLIKGI